MTNNKLESNSSSAPNFHPSSTSASKATSEARPIAEVDSSIVKSKLKEPEAKMSIQNGLCPTSASFTPGTQNDKYGASEVSLLAQRSLAAQNKRAMTNTPIPAMSARVFEHVGLNTTPHPNYPGMGRTSSPEIPLDKTRAIKSHPDWTKKSPKERMAIFPDCRFKSLEDMWAHQPTSSSKFEEIKDWACMVQNSMISVDADNVLKKQQMSNFRDILREYKFDGITEFHALVSQLRRDLFCGQRFQSDPLVHQLIAKIQRLEQFQQTSCAVMNSYLQVRVKQLYEEAEGAKRETNITQADTSRQLNEARLKEDSMMAQIKAMTTRIEKMEADEKDLKAQLTTKVHALKQSQKESKKSKDLLKRENETLKAEKAQLLSKSTDKLSAEVEEKNAKVGAVSEIIDTVRSLEPVFGPGQAGPVVATSPSKGQDIQNQATVLVTLNATNLEKDAAAAALAAKTAEIEALKEASAQAARKNNDAKEDLLRQLQAQIFKTDSLTIEMKQIRKRLDDVNLDRNILRREKEVLENKQRSADDGVMRGRSKGKGKKGKLPQNGADYAVRPPSSSSSGEDIPAVQDPLEHDITELTEPEDNGVMTKSRISSLSMLALFLLLIPHTLIKV